MINDLKFLKEMKEHWKKCKQDIVSYEMLGKMIDDWIQEIQDDRAITWTMIPKGEVKNE